MGRTRSDRCVSSRYSIQRKWLITWWAVMYQLRKYVGIPRAAWVPRDETVSALNPLPHGLPKRPWVASKHGGTFQQTSKLDHHGGRMAPWVDQGKADWLRRYHILQAGSVPGGWTAEAMGFAAGR